MNGERPASARGADPEPLVETLVEIWTRTIYAPG